MLKNKHRKETFKFMYEDYSLIKFWLGFGVIMLIYCFVINGYARSTRAEINQRTATYTCYYNVEELDRSKVNIYDYNYAINDEKHEIYLAPKTVYTHRRTIGASMLH